MRQNHWTWIPSLFIASEIPATIITYVALLMFLQTHASVALSALYCGILFVPWALSFLVRERLGRIGYYHRQIQLVELTLVLVLIAVSLTFTIRGFVGNWLLLAMLLLSTFTVWHHHACSFYYDNMLSRRDKFVWSGVRMFFSQCAVILTYGLMLMFVGALEVLYRSIKISWSQGCYLVAGLFLVITIYHIFALKGHRTLQTDISYELVVKYSFTQKKRRMLAFVSLFVVLLPQSLMLLSRVVFLITPTTEGGLGFTIQDIAFAQGAVGVIGFYIGIVMCRQLLQSNIVGDGFALTAVSLGLSPCVYLLMTFNPPGTLHMLCLCTFCAQFFFGFGIPVCDRFIKYLSGKQYIGYVNYFIIPVVAMVMIPPICLSGAMLTAMGFKWFFAVDALLAPVAWLILYSTRVKNKLLLSA